MFPLFEATPAIITYRLTLETTHAVVGRRVLDARIVAVMLAHNVGHVLTFNGDDFGRFPEIVVAPTNVATPPSGQSVGTRSSRT